MRTRRSSEENANRIVDECSTGSSGFTSINRPAFMHLPSRRSILGAAGLSLLLLAAAVLAPAAGAQEYVSRQELAALRAEIQQLRNQQRRLLSALRATDDRAVYTPVRYASYADPRPSAAPLDVAGMIVIETWGDASVELPMGEGGALAVGRGSRNPMISYDPSPAPSQPLQRRSRLTHNRPSAAFYDDADAYAPPPTTRSSITASHQAGLVTPTMVWGCSPSACPLYPVSSSPWWH
jgi:hypothetical protein